MPEAPFFFFFFTIVEANHAAHRIGAGVPEVARSALRSYLGSNTDATPGVGRHCAEDSTESILTDHLEDIRRSVRELCLSFSSASGRRSIRWDIPSHLSLS